MRIKKLEVPLDLISAFTELVEIHALDNSIQGMSLLGDVEICLTYEPEKEYVIRRFQNSISQLNETRTDAFIKRLLRKSKLSVDDLVKKANTAKV